MAETNIKIKSRIVFKHDTEENWIKAVNFAPLKGELIIYDIDETYDYPRFKLGDGETLVTALPFINEDLRTIVAGLVDDLDDLESSLKTIATTGKLSDAISDPEHRTVTDEEKAKWEAKSGFSGKYEDLTGTPEIPSKVSDLTNDSGFVTSDTAAGENLGLVKTGGHVSIIDGVIYITDDSHNHTINNVDGLQDALNNKVSTDRTINGKALSDNISLTASDVGAIPASEKGAVNGIASLDETGKVPASQLPSYVDDVVEFENRDAFPETGESGKIYLDITSNISYRWGGTTYVEISSTIALGTTSSTAFPGDQGKVAYDHSQIKTGNPHGTSKSDIGLSNVENKSSADIRSEITKENVETALGFAPTSYTLTKDGNTITLTGADGSSTSVTDDGAIYSPAGEDLYGLVKSGGDVTITDGVITVNDDSHAHSNYVTKDELERAKLQVSESQPEFACTWFRVIGE